MTPFLTRNAKALVFVAAYLGAMGLFYIDYWPKLYRYWSDDDFSYCFLVPVICGYFLYRSRSLLLKPTEKSTVFLGYMAVFLAVFFSIAGRMGSMVTLVFFSMWCATAGGMLFVFKDQRLKHLLMPLFVLLFAIPMPAFITNLFSHKLRLVSSWLSIEALHALNVPAFREGNLIDLGVQTLEVADACSGLRYFFPILLMSIVMGALYHKRKLDRLILFVLAPVISILSNAFRITGTGILVKYVSPEYAVGFYHDLAGFVVYGMSLICLLALSWLLKLAFRRLPEPAAQDAGEEGPLYPRAPLHLGICCVLLLAAIPYQNNHTTTFIIPERTTFAEFPLQIGDWTGTRRSIDEATLVQLGSDDYFMGSFVNLKTGNSLQLLVPYYQQQTIAHAAHAPAACLLGSGWFLSAKGELQPSGERDFVVQRMVMSKQGQHLLSNFWFQQRGRMITDEYENKAMLFMDAVTRSRTDGALVRVEMLLTRSQTVEQGQAVLDKFLADLKPLLEPHIPGWDAAVAGISNEPGGASADLPDGNQPLPPNSISGEISMGSGN
ncbi:MAG: VPLPA-CTERM-specific exosortase XrtD [Okeania sp. SIO3B3]|nr:VPLPA-CTERM-specific exosortase XrtD [Okeania sp. SIO3B3]